MSALTDERDAALDAVSQALYSARTANLIVRDTFLTEAEGAARQAALIECLAAEVTG